MIYTTLTPIIAVPKSGRTLLTTRDNKRSFLRGEQTLNTRLITESEIAERQLQVRHGAHRARHAFTVSGVRQLIGNTFIALGTHLHGKSETRRKTIVTPASATAIGD